MKTMTLQEIMNTYESLDFNYSESAENKETQNNNLYSTHERNVLKNVDNWENQIKNYYKNYYQNIQLLANEYIDNKFTFREPVEYTYNEETGKKIITNGYTRLSALHYLINEEKITPQQAVVNIIDSTQNENTKETEHYDNTFLCSKNSNYSFFEVKFSLIFLGSFLNSQKSYAFKEKVSDELHEKLESFRVNRNSWVTMETANFTLSDTKGSMLFSIDNSLSKNSCDVENKHVLDQAKKGIQRTLENTKKEFKALHNVIILFSFEKPENINCF